MTEFPPVAVFDADLPTGLAVIRSLGRAGVPVTVYGDARTAMARHSRYASTFHESPPLAETDRFVSWLAEELRSARIGLVAPTSDSVMFLTACALDLLDDPPEVGHPAANAVLDCLLKQRFADALDAFGFPTPATAVPTSIDDACTFGRTVGYPLVSKPRTHVGAGVDRGEIYADEADLRARFTPYDIGSGHDSALRHDPDLQWPLLQEFIAAENVEVISVSGCLAPDGELLALGHSKKERLWPPKLGIGTLFVALQEQPFTSHAVDAARAVIGSGIFEFEVLYDPDSGGYWGIDLNPRAFGQLTLDIARGNDLPSRWYESVTGICLTRCPSRAVAPSRWQMGVPLFTDLTIAIATGPNRSTGMRELRNSIGSASVGAVADWRDPLPSILFNRGFLRHPGGLIRPYLSHN